MYVASARHDKATFLFCKNVLSFGFTDLCIFEGRTALIFISPEKHTSRCYRLPVLVGSVQTCL